MDPQVYYGIQITPVDFGSPKSSADLKNHYLEPKPQSSFLDYVHASFGTTPISSLLHWPNFSCSLLSKWSFVNQLWFWLVSTHITEFRVVLFLQSPAGLLITTEQLSCSNRDPLLPKLSREQCWVCSGRAELREEMPLCDSSWERGVRNHQKELKEEVTSRIQWNGDRFVDWVWRSVDVCEGANSSNIFWQTCIRFWKEKMLRLTDLYTSGANVICVYLPRYKKQWCSTLKWLISPRYSFGGL